MKNIHMALSLALSLSLASCVAGRHAVGPNYTRPVITAAPFHNLAAAKVVKAKLPSPQLDAWWTGFDDPMLVTVVQRALQQNLDLAAAFDRVTQARAAAAEAGAQLLPTADLDAAVTAQRQTAANEFRVIGSSFPGYSRNFQEYTAGPAASWEIDLAGAGKSCCSG
jgi:outer membrane protein TolC